MSLQKEAAEDLVLEQEDAAASSANEQMEEEEGLEEPEQSTDAPPPQHENRSHSAVMELVYDRLITSLSTDVALQMHRMVKTGVYPLSDLINPKDRAGIYPDIYKNKSDKNETKTAHSEVQKYSVFHPEQRKRRRLEDVEEKYFSSPALGQGGLMGLDPARAMAAIAEKEKAQSAGSTSMIPATTTTTAETTAAAATATQPTPPTSTNSKQPPAHITQQAQAPAQPQAQARTQPLPQPSHLDIWGNSPPKEPKDMVPCTLCGRQVNTLRYASHLDKCMGGLSWGRRAAMTGSGFAAGTSSRGAPK